MLGVVKVLVKMGETVVVVFGTGKVEVKGVEVVTVPVVGRIAGMKGVARIGNPMRNLKMVGMDFSFFKRD